MAVVAGEHQVNFLVLGVDLFHYSVFICNKFWG